MRRLSGRPATRRPRRGAIPGGLLLLLGLAAAVAAATLPRLPKDHPFPQGPDSPGVVTFSHASHVDADRPDCTVCHPKRFRILEKGVVLPPSKLMHVEMEAGRLCGSCHDGKSATGLDDCAACHK